MAETQSTSISNAGPMSEFINAFDVRSKVTDYVYHCRFSSLWNAIATRHSDTVDCKFFVDGRAIVVGLSHPGMIEFARRTGRNPSDRELSYIAAEYLRERLEQEDEHSLYNASAEEVVRLAIQLVLR
jgi:hypothetical protein